jgi:bacteriocin-like protein
MENINTCIALTEDELKTIEGGGGNACEAAADGHA